MILLGWGNRVGFRGGGGGGTGNVLYFNFSFSPEEFKSIEYTNTN